MAELEGVHEDSVETSMPLVMVGKVLTVRLFNFEAIKRTLNQICTISKAVLFRQLENDLFVVQFATSKDKEKIIAGRPWNLDNNLVLLEEIEGSSQPSNIKLTCCPFRLHLYNSL